MLLDLGAPASGTNSQFAPPGRLAPARRRGQGRVVLKVPLPESLCNECIEELRRGVAAALSQIKFDE